MTSHGSSRENTHLYNFSSQETERRPSPKADELDASEPGGYDVVYDRYFPKMLLCEINLAVSDVTCLHQRSPHSCKNNSNANITQIQYC